jgi:integrase
MVPIDVPADPMTAEDEKDEPRRKTRVEWVHRWKDDVAAEPELPGVWRRRDGGFHVRSRVTDPRTGKMREVNRELPAVSRARDAFAWLQGELDRIRAGVLPDAPSVAPSFRTFAADVFKRKLDLGKIRSAAGKAKWESILEHHLVPAFGDIFIDRLAPADIKAWQSKVATKIKAGEMAPATANMILGVLRQITDDAITDFDIRDPMRGIDAFDTREHSTYTEEEPNSLSPEDVSRFLGKLRELHPEHYAFTFLGITTGLRPSSLRPLRRDGTTADVKWKEGLLIIRRSQTLGDEVMETTKTDLHQRLTLPRELLDVLRWHVDEILLPKKMRESELLFPSVLGSYRARSCLDKPFAAVCEKIKLPYRFTPRGMRRTYQDLARAAGVHDAVTRAISGHATPEMQLHYSTARGSEVKEALSKVANIATGAKVIDIKTACRRRAS